MAFEVPIGKVGQFIASTDFSSTGQFRLMKASTTRTLQIEHSTGPTDVIVGVLQNKPSSGEAAEITAYGVSKVETDGTVAMGDFISGDSSGRAQASTAGAYRAGVCIDGATSTGAAGDIVSVLLLPFGTT